MCTSPVSYNNIPQLIFSQFLSYVAQVCYLKYEEMCFQPLKRGAQDFHKVVAYKQNDKDAPGLENQ